MLFFILVVYFLCPGFLFIAKDLFSRKSELILCTRLNKACGVSGLAVVKSFNGGSGWKQDWSHFGSSGNGTFYITMVLSAYFSYVTNIKGMPWPIFCIDVNTHSDRKSKNYVKFILKKLKDKSYFITDTIARLQVKKVFYKLPAS